MKGIAADPNTAVSLLEKKFGTRKSDGSKSPATQKAGLASQQPQKPATVASIMAPVLNASSFTNNSVTTSQERKALLQAPTYEHHTSYGDRRPPMVVAADQHSVDEFQIYNDYVRRMTQRHQLILESAKRDNIQSRLEADARSLEKARQEQQERDSQFLKQGTALEEKSFLQKAKAEAPPAADTRSTYL